MDAGNTSLWFRGLNREATEVAATVVSCVARWRSTLYATSVCSADTLRKPIAEFYSSIHRMRGMSATTYREMTAPAPSSTIINSVGTGFYRQRTVRLKLRDATAGGVCRASTFTFTDCEPR